MPRVETSTPAPTSSAPRVPAPPAPAALLRSVAGNPATIRWESVNEQLGVLNANLEAGTLTAEEARSYLPALTAVQARADAADKDSPLEILGKVLAWITVIIGLIWTLIDAFDGNTNAARSADNTGDRIREGRFRARPAGPRSPTEGLAAPAPEAPRTAVRTPERFDRSPNTPMTVPRSVQAATTASTSYNVDRFMTRLNGVTYQGLTRDAFTQVQNALRDAQAAAEAGNYVEARRLYRQAGLPLGEHLTLQQELLLVTLGAASFSNGSFTLNLNTHSRSLEGMARNVELMAAMQELGVTPLTNPPTREARGMYVDRAARAADPQTAAGRTEAAVAALHRINTGTLIHHHEVNPSAPDLTYGANTPPHYYLVDGHGIVATDADSHVRVFTSRADAERAARELNAGPPPITGADAVNLYLPQTNGPDSFEDITTNRDQVDVRRAVDCEGEAYSYLLSAAGARDLATSEGRTPSVVPVGDLDCDPLDSNNQPMREANGNPRAGHELAVVRGEDGSVWILSSSDPSLPPRRVDPGADGVVSNGDIQGAAEAMLYESIYRDPPPDSFRISFGASGDPAEAMRSAAEQSMFTKQNYGPRPGNDSFEAPPTS